VPAAAQRHDVGRPDNNVDLMPDLADYFRTMARNNRWSNHRLHRACAALSAQEYFRDRGAFFRSIHGTLNHVLLVDQHYLAVLQGVDIDPLPLNHQLYPDLATIVAAQEAHDQKLIAFCDRFTAVELERTTRWADSNGDSCEDPVHVVLAHLFLHQIHHRGQVHNLLTTGGFAAPQLDEFLLSHDAPLREAGLREINLSDRAGGRPTRRSSGPA
jgi:uncharacterized damage-inducible protein DinB